MNKNILNNYTFIIAVRKGSQRVKNKNTRKFGDSNLVAIKLKQIRRLSKKANILLSSDCPKSLSLGKKYGAEIDAPHKNIAVDKLLLLLHIFLNNNSNSNPVNIESIILK